ncbi:right-handed parallel beta-helix repeat-containing protein [Nocardia yamanashiensis]|uniref:right-handed parallel beta-helix repeat-containing protein n=1 Tax=Nocardia yamanashiensis TaxID=209247 RepID=UPI001E59CE6B|nr:right-handed parallel beta-helix repeat-containing protein [Nocardia yamanashiensis]UGT43138.1 right-handed parallel beta-helix repeat-containing protein [Nocardia yamanashiensis]
MIESRRLPLVAAVVLAIVTLKGFDPPIESGDPRLTYYLGADGDDAADGRTPATAWRTLDRVTRRPLAPGERVLLRGGDVFTGTLRLGAADAGDERRPVWIGSYGSGRATIDGSTEAGVLVQDTGGVRIGDLTVVGAGGAADGVAVYTDRPGTRPSGIVIEDLEVSGFRNGVSIGTTRHDAGYHAVTVRRVTAHGNTAAGVTTYGPEFDAAAPVYANTDVTVSQVAAFGNTGDPAATVNTGSGIVLGSVSSGRISGSVAYGNGARAVAGQYGIWTYDSTQVVIEHNVSHHNRTGGVAGGGFDLDQNTSYCVLQHNLSYSNDGPGFLLFSAAANRANFGNVVRFNASVDDGRRGGRYGGITILGGLAGPASATGVFDAEVHGNTVTMGGSAAHTPPALRIAGTLGGVVVHDNVLTARDDAPLLLAQDFTVDGIALWANTFHSRRPVIDWSDRRFTTTADWIAATGQS